MALSFILQAPKAGSYVRGEPFLEGGQTVGPWKKRLFERLLLRLSRAAIDQKRLTASVNAYLILRKQDQVLLILRKNTGYLDEHWSLPAGHVELGESATAGMIREAKEELGIALAFKDLKVVHVMHRKTNRLNIDIFFECHRWQGDIENREPKKCGGIAFFSTAVLPSPIVDYNKLALKALEEERLYSEWGFL